MAIPIRLSLALLFLTAAGYTQVGTTSTSPRPRPAVPAPAPAGPPAQIRGRVLNAATGEPVKRANVTLTPLTAASGPPRPFTTITDADGRFVMVELAPGVYNLAADKAGFVRIASNRLPAPLSLGAGEEKKDVEIKLQPHGVATGRVLDEYGEPIANVQVMMMRYSYSQGKRQLQPLGSNNTNDLGEYRLFGLAPGRYYLSATYRTQNFMAAVDRSPRANEPEDGYAPTYFPGTLDSNSATPIEIVSGRTVAGMDITLLKTRTVRVHGRITNVPQNRVMVSLQKRGRSFMMMDRYMATTSSPSGEFEIRGVIPGSYLLSAQFNDGEQQLSGHLPVEVGTTNVEGLELALSPGQDVSGSIQVVGEGSALRVSGIQVFLESKDLMEGGRNAAAKEDGGFQLRGVPAGSYTVRAMGGGPFYVKAVYAGDEEAKDAEVQVLPGVPTTLKIVMSTAVGTITGVARNESGQTLPGAQVVLVPEPSKRQAMSNFRTSPAGPNGQFRMTGVPPGTYTLIALDQSVEFGRWMDPEFLEPFEKKGVRVTVAESSNETRDVTASKLDN